MPDDKLRFGDVTGDGSDGDRSPERILERLLWVVILLATIAFVGYLFVEMALTLAS